MKSNKGEYIGRKIGSMGFIISLFGAVFLWKEICFPLIMGLTVINIGIIYSAFEEKKVNKKW